MIGICPRCGRELVRSSTPTGKVCFRCPSCGGVAVTLPVLRESLDARSIAALTVAARAAEHAGCTCPGCGGRMTLLKVGDGRDKLEIDVCGRCLSVWCDNGEYETLAAVERRIGHARFIGLFLAFMAVSTLAHMIFETTGLASGYLCGISPSSCRMKFWRIFVTGRQQMAFRKSASSVTTRRFTERMCTNENDKPSAEACHNRHWLSRFSGGDICDGAAGGVAV